MDISDGLGFELQRLSKINKKGFEFSTIKIFNPKEFLKDSGCVY